MIEDRWRAGGESDAKACGDEFGEGIEADHAAYFGLGRLFEGEVGEGTGCGAVVDEVVGVVLEDEEIVFASEFEDFYSSFVRRRHASWVATILRAFI